MPHKILKKNGMGKAEFHRLMGCYKAGEKPVSKIPVKIDGREVQMRVTNKGPGHRGLSVGESGFGRGNGNQIHEVVREADGHKSVRLILDGEHLSSAISGMNES